MVGVSTACELYWLVCLIVQELVSKQDDDCHCQDHG